MAVCCAHTFFFFLAGRMLANFPVMFDEIHTQVAAADFLGNRQITLIVADRAGNIVAIDRNGTEIWETRVVGYPTESLAVGDVNGDGVLDVVVTTSAGFVAALRGDTGKRLDGFPVRLPASIRAPPTLLAMEYDAVWWGGVGLDGGACWF